MSKPIVWSEIKKGDRLILVNEFITDTEGKRQNVVGTFSRLLVSGDVLVAFSDGTQRQMRVQELELSPMREIWE